MPEIRSHTASVSRSAIGESSHSPEGLTVGRVADSPRSAIFLPRSLDSEKRVPVSFRVVALSSPFVRIQSLSARRKGSIFQSTVQAPRPPGIGGNAFPEITFTAHEAARVGRPVTKWTSSACCRANANRRAHSASTRDTTNGFSKRVSLFMTTRGR